MLGMVELLLNWLASLVKSERRLRAENLILRHQVNLLLRKRPQRIRLSNADRLAFVWLYRSATLSMASRIAAWTRRSGSFSSLSPALMKPTGAPTTSSPLRAFS